MYVIVKPGVGPTVAMQQASGIGDPFIVVPLSLQPTGVEATDASNESAPIEASCKVKPDATADTVRCLYSWLGQYQYVALVSESPRVAPHFVRRFFRG